MDIQYLLFLQNFRNGINDALTPFMEMISLFAVTYLIISPRSSTGASTSAAACIRWLPIRPVSLSMP